MSATKKKPLTFDVDRGPPLQAEKAKEPHEARKQVGARVTTTTYRRLKARAAIRGEKVQELIERAITEFLANHPD